MADTDETVKKQDKYHWLRKYQFKPGESGNPKGRPRGSLSIKELVRSHLEKNPDDLVEFVKHFIEKNRELAWQMIEGKPQQDITSGGEKLPTPILGDVSTNNSNETDKESQEEN